MDGESVGDVVTRVLRARSGEPVTASEVAGEVGCVRRTAHKHLTRLAESGGRSTHWTRNRRVEANQFAHHLIPVRV